MTAEPLDLADGFAAPSRDLWRRGVDKVLDRSGDLDAEALEARFAKVLVTTTIDGLTINPLYAADDPSVPPPAPMPGQAPYLRGTRALDHRSHGWHVRQSVDVGGNAADVAAQILDELERGTTQVLLHLDVQFATATDLVDRLDAILDGVYLDLATLALDASGHEATVAAALVDLAKRRGDDPGDLRMYAGIDPIGRWLRSAGSSDLESDLDDAAQWVERAQTLNGVVPLSVDASLIHEAGGGEVEELGTSLAWGVEVLRALEARGVAPGETATAIEFTYAATPDQFSTIAKFRAARALWHRVTSAAGLADGATAQRQHGVTSAAAASRYDVWVNLLRSTIGAFGAGVGGADAVTVRPHDHLVTPGGSPIGRRMARNAQLILIEESHLAQVVDLAGGSWYVESLTDQLARAAWAWFQTIEAEGGLLAAARSGMLQDRIDQVDARRERQVATRRHPLTGVSEFPDIGEDPPPPLEPADVPNGPIRAVIPRRHGRSIEALRARADHITSATGQRPEVFLANIGTPAAHTARATFAKNLFEVAGIQAIVTDGFDDPTAAAQACASTGATLACICGSDADYADQAVAYSQAIRAESPNLRRLYLAGQPAGLDDALSEAGVDEQIAAGVDLIDGLTRALDELEDRS